LHPTIRKGTLAQYFFISGNHWESVEGRGRQRDRETETRERRDRNIDR
jgi:hypothetical protein